MTYTPVSWDQALYEGWNAAEQIKHGYRLESRHDNLGRASDIRSSEVIPGLIQGPCIMSLTIVGMGGSGIAGQLLGLMSQHFDGAPGSVIDGPIIGRVVQNTLYVVCSYSGNTWETLHAFDELYKNGANMVVLTSGGQLASRAAQHKVPCITLPAGLVPRGALPWFLGSLLALCESLTLLPGKTICEQLRAHWRAVGSRYQDKALYDPFLVHIGEAQTCYVWGVRGDTDAAAYRLQTQLNENSKLGAVTATIPELHHNLLVGFTPEQAHAPIVMVMTDHAHKLLRVAADSLTHVLAQRGIPLYKVPLLGDNWLSQCAASIWWADGASYFLGCARGYAIDATVLIDQLKQNFSKKVA